MTRYFLIPVLALLIISALCRGQAASAPVGAAVKTEYPEALQKAGVRKARCIFKDSRGMIWIGTDYGLYRYDGTNVDYLYHKINDRNTIPSNIVFSLCEDKQGNIWAGTQQGVACISAASLKCSVYTHGLGNFTDDFDNKVLAGADGGVWVGNSTGLWRLNSSRHVFELKWHSGTADHYAGGYISCLVSWKKDTLAAGTFDGLVLVNLHNFGYRRIKFFNDAVTVTRLYVDSLQRIWAATWGHGCMVTDSRCSSFKVLSWENQPPPKLANVVINIISAGRGAKTLWISTTQGLYRIDGYLDTARNFKVQPVATGDGSIINGMLADDDQYIWLAGLTVSRFFAGQRFFNPFIGVNGSVQDMQQLVKNGKKCLAVSTWYASSGLTITDEHSGKLLYRQPDQPEPDLSAISGIAIDKYNRTWVSFFKGVTVLDSNFTTRQVKPAIKVRNELLMKPKIDALRISGDTVWLACYKKGIELRDLNFNRLKAFTRNDGSGLKDNLFSRFFRDSRGTMWVCGNSYLYKYLSKSAGFIAYNLNEENGPFSVADIAETADHQLLVAADAGLFMFNPLTAKSSRISTPLVKEDDVESVAVDIKGNIWYITREHLVYYQPKINHFTVFGQEDGLNTRDDLQLLRTFDGETFYLAESGRIVTFSPLNARKDNHRPEVYIHAVQVNDSTLSHVPPGEPLSLRYNQNRLYVDFGEINYIKPGQNLYAYKLAGLEDRWIYTTRNNVSYDNLAPRKYTLYVKAQNSSGLWSKTVMMPVLISPPFWGTWWFRILAFAVVSSMVFFAIRFVAQRNLREQILTLEKEQAIEKERNRIARDMHDDLGSGLTKIAILSELTQARIANSKPASAQLETISAVSREMVDSLQNIVWLLNPKNDSLESLALYIRRYVNNFFESSGILPVFEFPEDTAHTRLSEEQRRNIFLVVKEACNNTLKHSGATTVVIKLSLQAGELQLALIDNGKGFDTETVGRLSNGLRNMLNRAAQAGGEFTVLSRPGAGTTVALVIK